MSKLSGPVVNSADVKEKIITTVPDVGNITDKNVEYTISGKSPAESTISKGAPSIVKDGITFKPDAPFIPKEQDASFYNGRYKYGYNWFGYQNLGKQMLDMMKMTGADKKKILDVGCGMGWFTDHIYHNVSINVKGIDFSDKAIKFLARKISPCVEFEVADIFEYDYTGYEIFVLMEVLEHIEKDKELVSKIPTGAKVYATIPFEKMRMDMSHLREYTVDTVKERYGDILDLQSVVKFEQFIIFWGVRK